MVIVVAVMPGAEAELPVVPPPPQAPMSRAATTRGAPRDAESIRIHEDSISTSIVAAREVSPILLSANSRWQELIFAAGSEARAGQPPGARRKRGRGSASSRRLDG